MLKNHLNRCGPGGIYGIFYRKMNKLSKRGRLFQFSNCRNIESKNVRSAHCHEMIFEINEEY